MADDFIPVWISSKLTNTKMICHSAPLIRNIFVSTILIENPQKTHVNKKIIRKNSIIDIVNKEYLFPKIV